MSKPLIVVVPHQLGQAEARRRLDDALGQAKAMLGQKVTSLDGRWTENHLDLMIGALGQKVTAALDVAVDHVRVEVQLPWMLAMIAEKATGFIRKQGQLLLEKK
jgi:predicted lipid carrier protein YhbT